MMNGVPMSISIDTVNQDNIENAPPSTSSANATSNTISNSNTNNAKQGHPPSLPLSPRGKKSKSMPLSPINGNNNNNGNEKDNTANTNDNKDKLFQQQIEIQSLKHRLQLSSTFTKKADLLEILSEKDISLTNKNKQISILHDKFHKITTAVQRMETEVHTLRKDKHDFENDNKRLKRHLNIREKEVKALVSRCTVQEEKLNEGKESRVLERRIVQLETNHKVDLDAWRLRLEETTHKLQTIIVKHQKVEQEYQQTIKSLKHDHGIEVMAVHKKMADVQESNGQLERQLVMVEVDRDSQIKQIKNLNEKLGSSERKVKELERDGGKVQQDHEDCIRALEMEYKDNMDKAIVEQQSIQKALSQQQQQQQELQKQHNQEIEQLNQLHEQTAASLTQTETKYQQTATQLTQSTQVQTNLKAQIQNHLSTISTLEAERDELVTVADRASTFMEGELVNLKKDRDDVHLKWMDKCKEVEVVNENVKGLEGKVEDLEDQVQGLEREKGVWVEKDRVGNSVVEGLRSDISVLEQVSVLKLMYCFDDAVLLYGVLCCVVMGVVWMCVAMSDHVGSGDERKINTILDFWLTDWSYHIQSNFKNGVYL